MADIYEETGFVEVEKNDVVVDVGSYLGAFSKQVADEADTVFAIDPYYAFGDCYRLDLDKYGNIRLIPKAAWNEQTTIALNLSRNPSENSVLAVDSRATGGTVQVEANTVSGILEEENVSKIDFLKIEAEGVEPEILEEALEMNPSKISIQANEERNGDASFPEVLELLDQEDYEIRSKNKMVYARRR
jgi:FkbM family methyltransferase